MVSALLMLLVVAVLQLALAVYVRNTLIDAAAEGARYAALADHSSSDGANRTAELIRAALGDAYARDITAQLDGDIVDVGVWARVPLLGLLGVDRSLEVHGHAIREPAF